HALLLGLLTVCLAGAVDAQGAAGRSREVPDARAADRARDYERAALPFAEAPRPGYPHAPCTIGNCRFRQGRHPEALVAFEAARLVMPRDAELLANIRLTRARLDLAGGEGEGFWGGVTTLWERFTARELFWLAVFANLCAAGLLCF